MIEARPWRGLSSNVGRRQVPPGFTIEQLNLGNFTPGRVQGRRGLRLLDYTNYAPDATVDIISMSRFQSDLHDWLVAHRSDGSLKAYRDGAEVDLASAATLSAFQPASWARDRRGLLYAFNGLQRGRVWDGVGSTLWQAGITAPGVPTISNAGIGSATLPQTMDTGSDLIISASSAFRVRSPTHAFVAGEIGMALQITAGTGFTVSMHLIEDVVDGEAVLNGSAGTPGSTGGSWNLIYTPKYYFGVRYVDGLGLVSNLSPLQNSDNGGDAWQGGFDWTLTPSTEPRVRWMELYRSTPDQDATLWLVARLPNNGTVSSCANNGSGKCRFTLPKGHGVKVGMSILMAGNSVSGYNTTHVITAIADTTIDTDINFSATGSAATWTTTAYSEAAVDDDDLVELEALPILDDDDNLFARRHDPPPTNKPFMAIYQDTAYYYGNVYYDAGTVSISGATVTGSGTAFTSDMVGWYLYPVGGTKGYEVEAVGSGTALTLAETAPTLNDVAYVLRSEPAESRLLWYSEPDLPESVPAENNLPLQSNDSDWDRETGLMLYGSYLWLLHERHLYRHSFAVRPADGLVTLSGYRGCLNNRCWVIGGEFGAFLMDQAGCYKLNGVTPIPLSDPALSDLWRDGTIDLTKSDTFHVGWEPNEKVVRFYVVFTVDGGTAPRRALCYNAVTEEWWIEKYHREILANTQIGKANRQRLVVGTEDDRIYFTSEGTTDEVAAIQGTATGATSTTLSDSAAPFGGTNNLIGAPVAIIAGTGAGQYRIISANTTSELTVPAWSTTPDATSIYLVGAIECAIQTGVYNYEIELSEGERAIHLAFAPTTVPTWMEASLYLNRNATPIEWMAKRDFRAGEWSELVDLSREESYVRKVWDKTTRGYRPHDRWASVRFAGFQGASRIELDELAIDGVVG